MQNVSNLWYIHKKLGYYAVVNLLFFHNLSTSISHFSVYKSILNLFNLLSLFMSSVYSHMSSSIHAQCIWWVRLSSKRGEYKQVKYCTCEVKLSLYSTYKSPCWPKSSWVQWVLCCNIANAWFVFKRRRKYQWFW